MKPTRAYAAVIAKLKPAGFKQGPGKVDQLTKYDDVIDAFSTMFVKWNVKLLVCVSASSEVGAYCSERAPKHSDSKKILDARD